MFGFLGKVAGVIIGHAKPYASRVGGAPAAALAVLFVGRLGITEEMAADSAAAVFTLVMLLVYALSHKTVSKVTNPADDA